MNTEKLNQLFELATGSRPKQVKQTVSYASKKKAEKAKGSLNSYTAAYKDPVSAWKRWYEDNIKNIDSENVDDVWSFAEGNHPTGKDDARNYLRGSMKTNKNPVAAEAELRNKLTKSPSWLVEETMPEMNKLGAVVSNQNLIKARKIYASTLEALLMKLPLNQLDPDVPTEVHVKDLLKLELLGSMETAKIVNGRFAIMSKEGVIQPAFMLETPQEIGQAAPEELDILTDLVPEVATPIIESALSQASGMAELGNKAASGAALQMLKRGMPVEQWGDVFSLTGQPDIETGIRGLVENKDYGYEDLIRLTAQANAMYGGNQ